MALAIAAAATTTRAIQKTSSGRDVVGLETDFPGCQVLLSAIELMASSSKGVLSIGQVAPVGATACDAGHRDERQIARVSERSPSTVEVEAGQPVVFVCHRAMAPSTDEAITMWVAS
jgi:hypothetical protein